MEAGHAISVIRGGVFGVAAIIVHLKVVRFLRAPQLSWHQQFMYLIMYLTLRAFQHIHMQNLHHFIAVKYLNENNNGWKDNHFSIIIILSSFYYFII